MLSVNCWKKYFKKLPKETIALNPQIIGKIDPASMEIKEKEKRTELEENRLKKFTNRRKKNTRKLKDHIAKDIFKDQIRREHVVGDKRLRKQFYEAEKKKAEGEIEVLNDNINDIVKMSKQFIEKIAEK